MYQDSARKEQKTTSFLVSLLHRYIPFWPLFLIAGLLAFFVGVIYLKNATPIYESSAKLLIKDEKKGLDESAIMEALDPFASTTIVENEIEILKSIQLLTQVVTDLQLYAPIFIERRFTDEDMYDKSPVIITVKNPDQIKNSRNKLFFTYDSSSQHVKFQNKYYKFNEWFSFENLEIKFSANKFPLVSVEPDATFYFRLIPVYNTAVLLSQKIVIDPVSKQASIINLKLKDENTRKSEDILNYVIAVYNKEAVEDKNKLATNTYSFVNSRLEFLVRELDSIEGKIQGFKSKNKLFDISTQGKIYLETTEKSNSEISNSSIQLSVLEEVQRYVKGDKDANQIIPSTLGIPDPVLAELISKYYTIESRLEALKQTTGSQNPIALALRVELDGLKPKILQNIETQKRSLSIGSSAVSQERDKYVSILNSIPTKERELLQISREQSIKNTIYSFLLQKREETALSLASAVADSRVIDKAHSSLAPISPNPITTMGSLILLSFLLTIGYIFAKESLSRKVIRRTELEQLTSVPVLAEIYQDPSKEAIVVSPDYRSIAGEQFRQLRASLRYLGINHRLNKKILITSNESGEGKSFVSANLAISLSLMDKKVALLELDLRRPKISRMLGISPNKGLTNYLISEVYWEDVVCETAFNNLFVIPCGPVPPNPGELIASEKLVELLREVENAFDFIIIDSAPIGPVSDAFVLSPLVDATLYIVRHAVTLKSAVGRLDQIRNVEGLKNIAIVFNGIKTRGLSSYGNEYGYGYSSAKSYVELKK